MSDADWQTDATEPVLRILYQADIGVSPETVVANAEAFLDQSFDESTVRETLAGLESEGLVRELEAKAGYYLLTEHGRDYVETEIDREAFGFVD